MGDTTMIIPNFNDDNNDDKNKDLGGLMRGLGQMMIRMSDELDSVKATSMDTQDKVTGMEDKVTDLALDVDDLKNNQFVDPNQDYNIQRAARIRVTNLLGIVWENGGVAEESMRDYKLYYSKFLRALHSDAKKQGLEGRKIHQTPRRNYQALIEFIGEWRPIRGVEGQKEYYDNLAKCDA